MNRLNRRHFLGASALATAAATLARPAWSAESESMFEISLAQWSLNRQFFGRDGVQKIDPLDFAKVAKRECGIDAIEYVNQFYFDAIKQPGYVQKLKQRADDEGVKSLLIMCDREGNLGDPDEGARATAVQNHQKWLEWAAELGCHSIRVNAASDASLSFEEQQELAADGLSQLCELADSFGLNVIVENHGGLSSHGRWLREVMEMVDSPRVGTLPDFGNFFINRDGRNGEPKLEYNRYLGVYELMPYAKGVSAKSHEFDDQGNEVHTDFARIMKIVVDSGFRGYVGVEYEGGGNSFEGIRMTKELLERTRDKLAA